MRPPPRNLHQPQKSVSHHLNQPPLWCNTEICANEWTKRGSLPPWSLGKHDGFSIRYGPSDPLLPQFTLSLRPFLKLSFFAFSCLPDPHLCYLILFSITLFILNLPKGHKYIFIRRPTMDSTTNCWLGLLLFFSLLSLPQSQGSHHHWCHRSQGPLVHFRQKMKSPLKEHGP